MKLEAIRRVDVELKVNMVSGKIAAYYEKLVQPEKLVLLGVMDGAMPFLMDLARELHHFLPVEIKTVKVKTYGDARSPQNVPIMMGLDIEPGSTVLVVDDIVDTGRTMEHIVKALRALDCNVETCSFLLKARSEFKPTWFCQEVPNEAFAVGYGMDYGGLHREWPWVEFR